MESSSVHMQSQSQFAVGQTASRDSETASNNESAILLKKVLDLEKQNARWHRFRDDALREIETRNRLIEEMKSDQVQMQECLKEYVDRLKYKKNRLKSENASLRERLHI